MAKALRKWSLSGAPISLRRKPQQKTIKDKIRQPSISSGLLRPILKGVYKTWTFSFSTSCQVYGTKKVKKNPTRFTTASAIIACLTPSVLFSKPSGELREEISSEFRKYQLVQHFTLEMEKTSAGRILFLCGFLLTSLLIHVTSADGTIKEVTDPTGNVNLSPTQQWESVYECLQNTSDTCQDKYKLTLNGWLNVTAADTQDFCRQGGCADHTKAVLLCIHLVKSDCKFASKATVGDLNYTIKHGCSLGFNGTTLIGSNARRMSETQITLVVLLLPVYFLVTYFHV